MKVFLLQWQTLIGSSFAILAAVLGGLFIQRQMRHAEQIENARYARKFAAARANLPLALSGLSDYAFQTAQTLKEFYSNLEGRHLRPDYEGPSFPSPPAEAIANLSAIVECAPNANAAETISDLLGEIQVANSRLRRLHIRSERYGLFQSNIDGYVIDIADIHARISNMFDYARRESETIPAKPDLESVLSALNLLGFRETQFERVRSIVIRRYARRYLKAEPKSKSAKEALNRWISLEIEQVMEDFEVTSEGEAFVYDRFRYSDIENAVLYAALQRYKQRRPEVY